VDFVRSSIEQEMENEAVVEVYLLVTLKSSRLSLREVENMFMDTKDSTLDAMAGGNSAMRFA